MADRLIVFEGQGVFRIGWYLAEDQDMGATLGETNISDVDDPEYIIALEAILSLSDVEKDDQGFYWESKKQANGALRLANMAIKNRSMKLPEWAKQALAAGWKSPKGWKP